MAHTARAAAAPANDGPTKQNALGSADSGLRARKLDYDISLMGR